MSDLIFLLAAIALLDSGSMIPLSIMPIALILGGRNPIAGAAGFLLGILLAYFGGGLLLLFGLDELLERFEPVLLRWWNNPSAAELLMQFIVGIVLLLLARKIGRAQGKPKKQAIAPTQSPLRWFTFGAALTLGGLPGAIPYLGAIDQIIRAELAADLSIALLGLYNLVFIAPLLVLFLLPRLFPAGSEAIMKGIRVFFEKYGPRALAGVLALLGLVFAVDAAAFYFGYPLLPVGDVGSMPG